MTTMTAAQLRTHTGGMDQAPDPEVPERPRPPRRYPAAYKLQILEEYEQLDRHGRRQWDGGPVAGERPRQQGAAG